MEMRLEQEWSLSVVVADGCEAAAQLLRKFHPFDVSGSKRFERQRDERVRLFIIIIIIVIFIIIVIIIIIIIIISIIFIIQQDNISTEELERSGNRTQTYYCCVRLPARSL